MACARNSCQQQTWIFQLKMFCLFICHSMPLLKEATHPMCGTPRQLEKLQLLPQKNHIDKTNAGHHGNELFFELYNYSIANAMAKQPRTRPPRSVSRNMGWIRLFLPAQRLALRSSDGDLELKTVTRLCPHEVHTQLLLAHLAARQRTVGPGESAWSVYSQRRNLYTKKLEDEHANTKSNIYIVWNWLRGREVPDHKLNFCVACAYLECNTSGPPRSPSSWVCVWLRHSTQTYI